MPTVYVKSRGRGRSLLRTSKRRDGSSPANIVVAGIGTAGCRRALLMLQRFSELSALNRVQSAIFHDCNDTTVNHIGRYLRRFLGKGRGDVGVQIVFPGYVPLPNGFLRNPQHFHEFGGPLRQDMDNVVGQVATQSDRCGRAPSVIIVFMGFGGHAVLGGQLYEKLKAAFPSSIFLPTIMLPSDHVCEEWTRRYIWEQYESLLAGSKCLLTAQSANTSGDDDIRLATGLAAIEMAEFEDEDSSESPLNVVCKRLIPSSGGWLGMAAVKRRIPIVRKFQWLKVPPQWSDYAALGADEDTSMSLSHAIWATLEESSQMAAGLGRFERIPQEVVISLPIHPDALEPVASEAAEMLERTSLFARYPNMDVAFTTARFDEDVDRKPYVHIARMYPVYGAIDPIIDILHPGRRIDPTEPGASPFETGFGTWYHPDPDAYAAAALAAGVGAGAGPGMDPDAAGGLAGAARPPADWPPYPYPSQPYPYSSSGGRGDAPAGP